MVRGFGYVVSRFEVFKVRGFAYVFRVQGVAVRDFWYVFFAIRGFGYGVGVFFSDSGFLQVRGYGLGGCEVMGFVALGFGWFVVFEVLGFVYVLSRL